MLFRSEYAIFEGQQVPLDLPMMEEDSELGGPEDVEFTTSVLAQPYAELLRQAYKEYGGTDFYFELEQAIWDKHLDEISKLHGKNADETLIDLILADNSSHPIPCIYFLIDENNVQRMLQLPYVSICSDGVSIADEAPGNNYATHPRVYGSFARFLGKYVREEKLMSMEEGIRRMTSLPASNLKLSRRGKLESGFYADLVIFDSEKIQDRATFEDSHAYAEGVHHVFVNGVQVIKNGTHTGARPGRSIRGPGHKKR